MRFFPPWHRPSFHAGRCALTLCLLLTTFASIALGRGRVDIQPNGHIHVHLSVFDLPDPSRTDPATRAELEIQRAFLKDYPARIRQRWKANPERYTHYPLSENTEIVLFLHRFSGIRVEGVESTLLAIAGDVAPDILSVNFRQSDTYIQQGFLYPLDHPDDGYAAAFSADEWNRRIHPKIEPVIFRAARENTAKHLWALPSGPPLGRVVMYRKDIFDLAGIPYPSNAWTWADFMHVCKTITNPAEGIYAIGLSRGKHESYLWMPFLWGAGGDILTQDETGHWSVPVDTREAAEALDMYVRLTSEAWIDPQGRLRRGYAIKDTSEANQKWKRGQLGMVFSYLDDRLMSTINPDLTGIVALPIGPKQRGTEINSRMMGIFAGVKDTLLRDTAWEYIQYQYSHEAMAIRTRVLVEGGFGRFLPAEQLAAYGYPQPAAFNQSAEWAETFRIILEDGKPEPYGKNAAVVYDILTTPIREAEQLAHANRLPDNHDERIAVLQQLLSKARQKANAEMLQSIPPEQMKTRRLAAIGVLFLLGMVATAAIRQIIRTFRILPEKKVFHTVENPAEARPESFHTVETPRGRRRHIFHSMETFLRHFPHYGKSGGSGKRKAAIPPALWLLMLPALLTILIWHYIPLVRGSLMAFFDYRIFGASPFVGLDNFANLLWDPDWWMALVTSARYSFLVITMTFLPPLALAILLQEVPKGKIPFRLAFYLPATMSGLVVILLWKTWMEPSEAGLLNRVTLAIPAAAWLLMAGAALALAGHLGRRLLHHHRPSSALLVLAAGLLVAWTPGMLFCELMPPLSSAWLRPAAWWATLPEPIRWLDDSNTALFSCVLPMLWAGMGPGCLIYLAALKGIPDDLYEAADMDGATFTDKVLFIVIPSLRPLLVINFVGVFIASWQAEANILAMTGGGARTEVAGLHIFYKAFIYLRLGPATAAAWMLACLLIGFTIYQLRILSRVEFRANTQDTNI